MQNAAAARQAAQPAPTPVMRAWARDAGLNPPQRGRFLPAHIVDAYRTAHPAEAPGD